MNIDKLLIIIILIIIIFIIIFNHKYEHLTESNDKSTTLDALNNITDLISKDKITSKDLEITNNATINNNIKSKSGNIDNLTSKELTIDKINVNNLNVKDLNVSNNLINKNFTYFYDDNATVNLIQIENPPYDIKITANIYGIIDNNKNIAIISSNYFSFNPIRKKWIAIKEIILNSYNIILKPINQIGPMGNIWSYRHQGDNWNGMTDFDSANHFVLEKYTNSYITEPVYFITLDNTGSNDYGPSKWYIRIDTATFNIKKNK